ncbi:NuA4 histone acetyltransferase subunit [Taxawa tesnikishii (nom. ined.)]|nr:NuA4 histone acetyltransferase subunit [Dothideales sp. JES 119]
MNSRGYTKSVVPSFYGDISGQQLLGENAIYNPKPDLELRNIFDNESIVEDWDTAAKLWEYSITSRLTGQRQSAASKNGLNDPSDVKDEDGDMAMEGVEELEKPMAENPLLVSEPAWNPQKAREKTMEIAMESWGVPAFWMGKTGMLAAFAHGKPTALVVDIGARVTSVTPIFEGFVLKKGVQKSHLAGDYISQQIRLQFAQMTPAVPLVPHYMVKSKQPVDAGQPSNATYVQFGTPPTASFRKLSEERVLTSFKESVVQTWQGPGKLDAPSGIPGQTNADTVRNLPPKPFEMPDGWNQVFGVERFRVVEGLFNPAGALTVGTRRRIASPRSEAYFAGFGCGFLAAVDVEVRPQLLNHIVLTGGGSVIEKLGERLQAELTTLYPNPRVRVHVAPNIVDRKYGAWVGGSVLASLGTFHQMWISRKEYEEHGAGIVEKRCKS